MTLENEEQRNLINILKSELDSFRGEKSLISDNSVQLKQQIENYKKERINYDQKIKEYTEKLQKLNQENTRLLQEVNQEKTTNEKLNTILEENNFQINKLIEEKNMLQKTILSKQEKIVSPEKEKLHEKVQIIENEYSKIKDELNKTKEGLNQTQKVKEIQEDTISRLREDLKIREEMINSNLNLIQNTKQTLELEKTAAFNEAQKFKEMNEKIMKEINEKNVKISNLQAEIGILNKEIEIKNNEIKQYRFESENYKKEYEKLNKLTENSQNIVKDNEKLKNTNKNLDLKIEEKIKQINELKSENQIKIAEITLLQSKINEKDDELNSMTFKNKDLEKILSENIENIKKTQLENISVENRLKKHISENENISDILSRVKNELEILKEEHKSTLSQLEILKNKNLDDSNISLKRLKEIDKISENLNKIFETLQNSLIKSAIPEKSEIFSKKFRDLFFIPKFPEAKDLISISENIFKIDEFLQIILAEFYVFFMVLNFRIYLKILEILKKKTKFYMNRSKITK